MSMVDLQRSKKWPFYALPLFDYQRYPWINYGEALGFHISFGLLVLDVHPRDPNFFVSSNLARAGKGRFVGRNGAIDDVNII